MLLSVLSYALYLLLYIIIVFGQPYTTRLFGTLQNIDPYYDWFGLASAVLEGAVRALLCVLVLRHVQADIWRPFFPLGVFYVILIVLLPGSLLRRAYTVLSTRIVSRAGSNAVWAYMQLTRTVNLLGPLVPFSNVLAVSGCSIAWYRNSQIRPDRSTEPVDLRLNTKK